MKPFEVYPLFNIVPVKANGSFIYDERGATYLDLYGGHAVISIGHSHPEFVRRMQEQVAQISFYSNSVQIPAQLRVAKKLGELSGYVDYQLFFCNSGAEANENAMKLASFQTGRKKVLAFRNAFHGRTSAAVAATDDKSIVAPINETSNIEFCNWEDIGELTNYLSTKEFAAVIIEGIQGVAGVHMPSAAMLQAISQLCKIHGTLFICDEIQSGYGRTGKFFAHQLADVQADLITVAKGMGNGFPIGGVLIHPRIKARFGMLGTTFGGAHLACVAAETVLDVITEENLMRKADQSGQYLINELKNIPGIKEVRGAGLMIGIELYTPVSGIRKRLLEEHRMFTGSSGTYTLRVLPALNIDRTELERFVSAFSEIMESTTTSQSSMLV